MVAAEPTLYVETSRIIDAEYADASITWLRSQPVDITWLRQGPDIAHGLVDDRIASLPDIDDNHEQVHRGEGRLFRRRSPTSTFTSACGVPSEIADETRRLCRILTRSRYRLRAKHLVTPARPTGSASATVKYDGQWVALTCRGRTPQPGTGAISFEDGDASMTANFDTEKFTADLDGSRHAGQATLDGNGFSGMTAKVVSTHADLDRLPATSRASSAAAFTATRAKRPLASSTSTGGEAGAFRRSLRRHEPEVGVRRST